MVGSNEDYDSAVAGMRIVDQNRRLRHMATPSRGRGEGRRRNARRRHEPVGDGRADEMGLQVELRSRQ